MGTINFYTSNYITMAIKPYNTEDFTNEKGEIDYTEIEDYYEADLYNIQMELKKHDFYFFHITIKNGYYESFSLDIEDNFPIAFDSYQDRRQAQKEITEIKQFLLACANLGMVSCYPSWGTKYNDRENTIIDIHKAIKDMRIEVDNTPTWRRYNKENY